MHTNLVYLNGAILPATEAHLPLNDIGILRGYAVFDLLRTIGGRPFLLAEHLKRLRDSAAELGLTVPVSDAELTDAIDKLLAANGHTEATVRIVLTGGPSVDGMGFDPKTPTLFIVTADLNEPPASLYDTGGRLLTCEHLREAPLAKTTNYITKLLHAAAVEEAGALDLLYHRDGLVLEAASASVYFVSAGRILAPADDVLWGTIGSFTLDLVRDEYEIVEAALPLAEALAADECFLTSTTRGVVPIVRIDDAAVGDGAPGPVTRDLMARFRTAAFGV